MNHISRVLSMTFNPPYVFGMTYIGVSLHSTPQFILSLLMSLDGTNICSNYINIASNDNSNTIMHRGTAHKMRKHNYKWVLQYVTLRCPVLQRAV